MMRFGIIGSVNTDVITSPGGEVFRGFGGALYTAGALSRLSPGAEIWLLSRIGADAFQVVRPLIQRYPGIRQDGIRVDAAPNYRCELTYRSDGSKREQLVGDLPPLAWDEVEPYAASLDALLINFITGREIELPTLRGLRQAVQGPLIMDLHSLLLRTAAGGERVQFVPCDWPQWIEPVDGLQMNEREAALLAGLAHPSIQALAEFAGRLLNHGPRMVVITRGAQGAMAAIRDSIGCHILVEPSSGPQAVDPTGCGDVFLAVMGLGLVSAWAPERILQVACRVAGTASQGRGPEALIELSPMLLA